MLSPKKQRDVDIRLNKIKGQIEGVRKMVHKPRYCPDILNQLAAVRRAVASVTLFVFEDHLKTCVTNAIRKDRGRRSIKELIKTIDRLTR